MLTKPPYKIVRADQPDALEILVDVLVHEGYQALGGVSVSWDPRSEHMIYAQAMALSQPDFD